MLLLLGGCSLGRFSSDDCHSNAECVQAFGFGQVCTADATCSPPPEMPRCNTTFPPDLLSRPELYKDAVVVGTLFNHADPRRLARSQAARLAATQITDAGGLDGKPVGMVFCDIEEKVELDDQDVEAAAIASAEYLAESLGIKIVVGPSTSDHVVALFERFGTSGLVVISPSATSPLLTQLEDPPTDERPGTLWRTAPPDTLQGPSIARDMIDRGIKSAAILNRAGAYGDGLAEVFIESFHEMGGAATQARFSNPSQLSEKIVETGSLDVQEVLFISYDSEDITGFLEVAPGLSSFNPKTIFLTDGAATREAIDVITAEFAPRVRGSRPKPLNAEEDRAYANFLVNYQTLYGEDADDFSFTAHAFDAAWLAFAGAAWSWFEQGELSPNSVGRGLRRISKGEKIPLQSSGWGAIVEAFRAGKPVDVRGASGDLDFSLYSEEISAPIEIWTVEPVGNSLALIPVSVSEF